MTEHKADDTGTTADNTKIIHGNTDKPDNAAKGAEATRNGPQTFERRTGTEASVAGRDRPFGEARRNDDLPVDGQNPAGPNELGRMPDGVLPQGENIETLEMEQLEAEDRAKRASGEDSGPLVK